MKKGDKVHIPTVRNTEDYPGCLTENCYAIRVAKAENKDYLTVFIVDDRLGVAVVGTDRPDSTFKIRDLKPYTKMIKKANKKYTIKEIQKLKISVIVNNEQACTLLTAAGIPTHGDKWQLTDFEILVGSKTSQWSTTPGWFYKNGYAKATIPFDLVDLHTIKPVGYKLIKTYPGSKGLNYFEKYTTGELSKYPEFWEPVYEKEVIPVTIHIGDFSVRISKNQIKITGKGVTDLEISPKFLKDVLEDMEENQFQDEPNYRITFPFVKIGCSTFSTEDLELVLNEYNKLNGVGFH
jgi:hypothetical protein